jgi:hypothetical protein
MRDYGASSTNFVESNRARSAELSPARPGGMYLTTRDTFNFLRHGHHLYSMPHNEAELIYLLASKDKIMAIRVLRTFRQQLTLVDCKDMVEYVMANFIRCDNA